MPKVNIKKQQGLYVPNQFDDYLNRKRIRTSEIMEWIGCSQPTVSYKRKNKSFTVTEIAVIFDRSGATTEDIERVFKL